MTIPTQEQLLGGNAKAVKFAAPGDAIEGFIVGEPLIKPVLDDKGVQEVFKNSGDLKWQVLATLQTTLHDDEDDDGQRTLYIKSYMTSAVKQAIGVTGASALEPGGWLKVVYTHDGPKQNPMHSAPKLFTAEYRRPDPNAQVLGVGTGDPSATRFGGQANNLQYGPGGPNNPQPGTYQAPPAQTYQQPAPQPLPQNAGGQPLQYQPPQQYAPPQPVQQAPAPGQAPTPQQIAALQSAGLDADAIRKIYPGFTG